MAAGDGVFQYKHITASTVVAGTGAAHSTGTDNTQRQCVLHTVTINSAAATATIQIFDDNTTSSPANPVTGVITAPAGGYTTPVTMIFDTQMTTGITVAIAVAAADVTVAYR